MRSSRCCALAFVAALAWAVVLSHHGSAQDAGAPAATDAAAAAEALELARTAFEAADTALNLAYDRAREVLPVADFERLRLDQRAWLEGRDPEAATYARIQHWGGSEDVSETPDYFDYRTASTEMRLEYLLGLIAYHADPGRHGWDGFWVDGRGGHLAVRELDDGRLRFQLSVVRSPAAHTGWLEGIADRNGDLARFETTYEVGVDTEPVWLFLVRDGPYLRVHTANAQYFAGVRAYFDGDYVRLRDLEPFDID